MKFVETQLSDTACKKIFLRVEVCLLKMIVLTCLLTNGVDIHR